MVFLFLLFLFAECYSCSVRFAQNYIIKNPSVLGCCQLSDRKGICPSAPRSPKVHLWGTWSYLE